MSSLCKRIMFMLIKPPNSSLLKSKTNPYKWGFFSQFWHKKIEQTAVYSCLEEDTCNQGELKNSTWERTVGDQALALDQRIPSTTRLPDKGGPASTIRASLWLCWDQSQQAIYPSSSVSPKISPGLELQLQSTPSPLRNWNVGSTNLKGQCEMRTLTSEAPVVIAGQSSYLGVEYLSQRPKVGPVLLRLQPGSGIWPLAPSEFRIFFNSIMWT